MIGGCRGYTDGWHPPNRLMENGPNGHRPLGNFGRSYGRECMGLVGRSSPVDGGHHRYSKNNDIHSEIRYIPTDSTDASATNENTALWIITWICSLGYTCIQTRRQQTCIRYIFKYVYMYVNISCYYRHRSAELRCMLSGWPISC